MNTDELVSAKEAAKAVGMGLRSLYRLAKAGRIPNYSAGPKLTGVRFSIPEVKESLKRPVCTSPSGNGG